MSGVELIRYFYGPSCTLGHMTINSRLIYTAEDAWANNEVRRSCIPDGTYRCRPRFFHRGGYPAIEICDVAGRSTILFHRGNSARDVEGCIVVGTGLGIVGGEIAVVNSAVAWAPFFAAMGHEEFELTIRPLAPLKGTRS